MKHRKRRTSAGEMLMDVTKYLITVGLIGGILTDKISFISGISIFIIAIIIFLIAFFTIPLESED